MARVLRGDVVWADLDPTRGHEQAGQRPVLVISQDVFNQRSGTVIALALTSREPTAVLVLVASRWLPLPGWAQLAVGGMVAVLVHVLVNIANDM